MGGKEYRDRGAALSVPPIQNLTYPKLQDFLSAEKRLNLYEQTSLERTGYHAE